ncbi:MAG: HRDC domain-containing protein, partial [Candidatus Parabeggiatoa sp.]|nr:HRDC domain-containing protein [Candidatus Parabeggiatoa sp.]
DKMLWEALRRKRMELALEQTVPPYAIFHDSTLEEMVQKKPHTNEEFARLSGVGTHKLERYAHIFIDVLEDHALQYGDVSTG